MNETILLWINQGWAHPWLDVFFDWASDRELFAYPLVVIILAVSLLQSGRNGFKIWILLLVSVALGDAIGLWLKELLKQPRPCFDMWEFIRQPGQPDNSPCRRGTDGMPSNHTLNFFVIAFYMGTVNRSLIWGGILLVPALLVGISRIYLGAHYPFQVAVGACIGGILGSLFGWMFSRFLSLGRETEEYDSAQKEQSQAD